MSNVTYNGTLIGTASIAETVLPSGLPPAFTDVSITPSSASPYEISATDVGARLVVNSTSDDPIVNFLSSNTSSIPVGSRVQVAAFGRYCALNSTVAIGSPDLFFDPNANGTVNTLAIQSDGKIVIGGAFTTVGGTTRNRVARLNSDGTLDTGFISDVNNSVNALAIQSDGKIVIVGSFTTVDGTTRNRVARLNTDGTLDTGFSANANAQTDSVAIQSDGKIVLGGNFTTVSGTSIDRLARVNSDGTFDSGFTGLTFTNNSVSDIAIQSDGKILAGGGFSINGGAQRNFILRLNSNGTLDTAFDPNPNNSVSSVFVQSDGKIVVGGIFTSIVSATRNRIARLNSDGTLDTGFDPNASSTVRVIAIQSDGKIVIGGAFTTVGGTTRTRIARLNSDGTLDTSVDPSANNEVSALAIRSDGKVVIGGFFTTVGSATRNRVALLGGYVGNVSGGDSIYAPYALPTGGSPTLPRYAVLTLEKIAAGEWVVTESNVS